VAKISFNLFSRHLGLLRVAHFLSDRARSKKPGASSHVGGARAARVKYRSP